MACPDTSTHRALHAGRQTAVGAAVALAVGAYSACGPAEDAGSTLPYGSASGGSSSGAAGAASSAGSGVGGVGVGGVGVGGAINLDAGRNDTGADANCGSHSVEAQKVTKEVPVTKETRARADVFIMFDQSQSMSFSEGGPTRWQDVTQATIGFVQSPDSAELGVGIQFFGRQALAENCEPATYAQPEVPIAVLPGNAQPIVNAINGHRPSSETPTAAALTGAIQYARQWKSQNPMIPVFVLLVTDGEPAVDLTIGADFLQVSPCRTNVQNIASTVAAADAGAKGDPPIQTFVLGVGPALANLDQIASAGGTQQAYLISGGNVAQQVVDALNNIRGKISTTTTTIVTEVVPLDCEWVMPAASGDKPQDPTRVNVRLTSAAGELGLGVVPSQAECANFQNGWYYDNPDAPTKLIACPGTCDTIKAAGDAKIDILVGCETIIAPPK